MSIFMPVGLIMLSGALIFHNLFRGNYSDFATGLLMGMSIAMMIAGIVKQRRETAISRGGRAH